MMGIWAGRTTIGQPRRGVDRRQRLQQNAGPEFDNAVIDCQRFADRMKRGQ
jgi:hypothetical protein